MSHNAGDAAFQDVDVIGHTDKAILVSIPGYPPQWIPKSVITADSEVFEGDSHKGELIVALWFAQKNKLIS